MTELKPNHPVTRETSQYYRGRALVVRLHPGFVEVSCKGKRLRYALDYAAVFECAAKLAARRAAEEKKAAKRARTGAGNTPR